MDFDSHHAATLPRGGEPKRLLSMNADEWVVLGTMLALLLCIVGACLATICKVFA